MFIRKPYRLMFSVDPGFEVGAGNVDGGSTNALGGTVSQPPQEPAENPAWGEYLEQFPDSVRHIAKNAFSKWDQGVQQRFTTLHQQYQPFEQFKGIDPGKLNSAWGIAQALEADPVGFTKTIAQHLGLTVQEAEQVVQQAVAQENEPAEEDPRLTLIEQQQQQMLEYFQQQQQETQRQQMESQQEQELTAGFAELEKVHGPMQTMVKNEVLREMLRLSHERNAPVTVQEAYASLESFVSAIRNVPRPGATSPRTMPSGSAIPAAQSEKSFGSLSNGETKSLVANLLSQAQQQ